MLHLIIDAAGIIGMSVGACYSLGCLVIRRSKARQVKARISEVSEAKSAALTVLLTHIEEFHDEWQWGEFWFEHKSTKVKVWVANGYGHVKVEGPGLTVEAADISLEWKKRLWTAMKGDLKPYRKLVETLKPVHLRLDHEGDRPDPEPYRLVHFA